MDIHGKLECKKIEEKEWARRRKKLRKEVNKSTYYQQGKMANYLAYFSSANFLLLSKTEQQQHTLNNCSKCVELHSQFYSLRMDNKCTAVSTDVNLQSIG